MPEIVGTFARTELLDERANCSSEARNSSRRDLTEERLEFAVRQFDWIEVGRVFRQVAQRRVRFLNRLANGGPPCGRGSYPSRRCRCAGAWEPSTARYRRGTSLQSWHLRPPLGRSFCCGARQQRR